ncbi:hypothetical protein [Actinoplanes teichomyceticus]|uniref:Oligomerization/nucleic acid binding protein n=1 Tax=Actinoplanes teichomyceticus TaxID=1867 RepID=A0A561VI88_ACTTI|nr:hypothetical protein [Actinoplanes teichomyceticus]TWG11333.1 hypothetical protein FHX34_10663 [Actinoplanes teichomyceticus]GIF16365.1 hypothetical protein Ate01nite_63970 [Actinoplanes teichomyceticus]
MDALVIFFCVLLAVRAAAQLALTRPARPPQPPPAVDPCLAALLGMPPAPEPDQVLFARLASGEISKREYRDAMAELAARDARRRRD